MSILSLAPEILEKIIGWLPTQHDRQQATLQLTRALPRAPIPLQHLFEVVCLHDASQVDGFYQRIRPAVLETEDGGEGKDGSDGGAVADEEEEGYARMVRSLRIDAFGADSEIVVNILELVNDVDQLRISVGPTFLPTHLQAALAKPRRKLKSLEIRFRSCLESSIDISLDELYYDAVLLDLARWPGPSSLTTSNDGHVGLRSLSFIQEPVHSTMNGLHLGADESQPAVFPTFKSLTELLASPAMSALQSLTVRFPGRDVAAHLFDRSSFRSMLSMSCYCAARSLRILDLSATNASLKDLRGALAYTSRLTHLVLEDNCIVPIGAAQDVAGGWRDLGWICASVGQAGALYLKVLAESSMFETEMEETWHAFKAEMNGKSNAIRENLASSAAELKSIKRRLDSIDGRYNEHKDRKEERSVGGGNFGALKEREERSKQEVGTESTRISSSFTPSSQTIQLPPTILSKFGITRKTNIEIVPFPPTLRSLRVSHPCGVRDVDHDDNEASENRRIVEEVTARSMFQRGWESGLDELRKAWRSLREDMSTWSASSSEVALMFGDILFDGGDEWEKQEGTHQETELVLATTEALESLLVREFACPKLHFTGDEPNAGWTLSES